MKFENDEFNRRHNLLMDENASLRGEVEEWKRQHPVGCYEAGKMLKAQLDLALVQVDEAVRAAKEAKRMLLEHGYHQQAAVMYELDKITILKMDCCVGVPEYQRHFGSRKTICVHCDIEVPGNVRCPRCGR